MKVEYAVTFEFDNAPPITSRGVVVAAAAPTCAARAFRDAMAIHKGLHWSSMVCVLLGRVDR